MADGASYNVADQITNRGAMQVEIVNEYGPD
jgi:hypothetical protein